MATLLLSNLLCVLLLFVRLLTVPFIRVAVSEQCGPFRDHDFMFQVFLEGILELRDVRYHKTHFTN